VVAKKRRGPFLGKTPMPSSKLFERSGLDDHCRKAEDSNPEKSVGTMIAVAKKPAATVLGYLEEGTASMHCNRAGRISGNSEVLIGIAGLKQDSRLTANKIAHNWLRGLEGKVHQGGPVGRFIP
jgi:hypothetical protein